MEKNNQNSERQRIAERLKEARILAGLSQDQAAKKLGLQRPAISEIEAANRKVSAEEIIQFAKLYQVDESWLLLRESESDNERLQFAARELGKLSKEDIERVMQLLKILPK